jgi:excisionase family DNA binding protein
MNDFRRKQIADWRQIGLTYVEIGRRLGLSKERIRQIDKGISGTKKRALEFDIMLMPGEVARMLGVHVNTVRRWASRGVLRAYYIGPRGDRRFKQRDVEGFLVKNSSASTN